MGQELLTKNEYQQILQNPSIYLSDPRLKACLVEADHLGLPRVRSGGWALTYQLRNGSKKWAVRCFLKSAPEREQRYRAISRFISSHPSNILISIDFQPGGIQYKGKSFPLTLMDWVEGDTLGTYIFKYIRNSEKIHKLPDLFLLIVQELDRLKISHGDLSQQNILLSNDRMILIDYDGMYVPELLGQKSSEGGNLNFQHPGRNENSFGPELDWFSEIAIYLALKAISLSPGLYQTFGLGGEGLLFTQDDFRNPHASKLLIEISKLPGLKDHVQNFKALCQSSLSSVPPLFDFLNGNPIEVRQPEYVEHQPSFPTGVFPFYANHTRTLLQNENESVVVIGKIDKVREITTRRGSPCLFLNVGLWPNQKFTVVMWSEVLDLLKQSGRCPIDFQDQWISVSGTIDVYDGRPEIVLQSPADIAIITRDEAVKRLHRKDELEKQSEERTISEQSATLQANAEINNQSTNRTYTSGLPPFGINPSPKISSPTNNLKSSPAPQSVSPSTSTSSSSSSQILRISQKGTFTQN